MADQTQFFKFTDAGRLKVSSVTGQSLPAGATIRSGLAFAATGELLVDTGAPAGAIWVAGIRRRNDGATYVATATPAVYANGLPIDTNGALCVQAADPVQFNVVGLTANGAVSAAGLP